MCGLSEGAARRITYGCIEDLCYVVTALYWAEYLEDEMEDRKLLRTTDGTGDALVIDRGMLYVAPGESYIELSTLVAPAHLVRRIMAECGLTLQDVAAEDSQLDGGE